ncbi:MAG: hypothetical protein RQ741_07270 [Wenzhouxiangellaceae bacterium]|nr:hypothetical protein [Wenzhouxiangellaceae bacterium]
MSVTAEGSGFDLDGRSIGFHRKPFAGPAAGLDLAAEGAVDAAGKGLYTKAPAPGLPGALTTVFYGWSRRSIC